jgi:DHA2 family multidrug resistance protein-like MFS transporter
VLALAEAPAFTLTTDLVVGTAPSERAGTASAISETSSEFGGALGIAVLGSLAAAVYQLPDPIAAELLAVAREAFTDGMQIVGLASAALAAGTAVLVLALLRHARTGSEFAERPSTEAASPTGTAAASRLAAAEDEA